MAYLGNSGDSENGSYAACLYSGEEEQGGGGGTTNEPLSVPQKKKKKNRKNKASSHFHILRELATPLKLSRLGPIKHINL